MKHYRDTERGALVSETQLQAEFEQLRSEQPNEYNYSFTDYIRNATGKNGFLTELLW